MLISHWIKHFLLSHRTFHKISIKMSKQSLNQPKSRLAAFDFDCTVINANSDEVVQQLLPHGSIVDQEREFIEAHGWTKFMVKVFDLLHKNNVTPSQICNLTNNIPEVTGMINLLQTLHNKYACEIIIISDANSIFIKEWLKAHHLMECVSEVFTNPAYFDEKGVLQIKPYHYQDHCQLSAENLCKGQILQEYIKSQNKEYKQIIYTGDGQNDICPAKRLKSNDLVCAREKYSMLKHLQKYPEKYALKAKLIKWQDGVDLLNKLENNLI